MKLVRYGARGREKPGLIDATGALRDLSGHIADIGWNELSAPGQKRLRTLDPATLPKVRGKPRLGVPFTGISKIIGIGTPQGVGMGRGRFLQTGDRVRLGVDGLGEQQQIVKAAR